MATNDRATNQLTIDTNLPDNTTEAITPALHREVETDLNDSGFNKIDEPRDVAQTVAYVSNNGDDLTANLGDQSQPFATIQAAIDAVPTTNSTVVCLGGSYAETIDLSGRSNFSIDHLN